MHLKLLLFTASPLSSDGLLAECCSHSEANSTHLVSGPMGNELTKIKLHFKLHWERSRLKRKVVLVSASF